MQFRHLHIRKNNGFTLIELMITVSIIGILAAVSAPSMQRYYYEAKAAKLLVTAHEIRLLYEETLEIEGLTLKSDLSAYKSQGMGKAPPAFSEHGQLYFTDGILLYSQFNTRDVPGHNLLEVKDKPIPTLWLQAKTDHARKLLHAFDHITKQKHTWVMKDFMILDLE